MREKRIYKKVMSDLTTLADPEQAEIVARFGISSQNVLGIKIPNLRSMAKSIGKDHELALGLWDTHIFEAQLLASYIADPLMMDTHQAEEWVSDIDSWALCDGVCDLFARMESSYELASAWTQREEEFVKRAGFVVMVSLSIHDKQATNQTLEHFFPYIIREASDDRIYVRKAINWLLRQLGKKNLYLNERAIEMAYEIKNQGTRSAKWIATDALKELTSTAVMDRLHRKARKNASSDL